MFWLAVAAQLQMPTPDIRAVFSAQDFPEYLLREGINRSVPTRTTIRPDGMPQDCSDEGRGSGDLKLDRLTCSIIVKRARLRPAKWIDGSPSYAVVRVPVSYSFGGPPSAREIQESYPHDMDISVKGLPARAKGHALVPLMIAVDENGRIQGCDGARWVVAHDQTTLYIPELVPIACEQMTRQFTAVPAKDLSGKPVRSVQNAFVVFTSSS